MNVKDKDGMTAVMIASLDDRTSVVKALLEGGANVNMRDYSAPGMTSLMIASIAGNTTYSKGPS